MSRRVKPLFLAAGLSAALPIAPPVPASADWLAYGCDARPIKDPTDPSQRTYFEITTSAFIGTPDVTQWEITCWLQTAEDAYTPDAELANTRHTCSGTGPIGACGNPVIFETEPSDIFLCTHLFWTDSVDPGVTNPLMLVDHLRRDVFSTGGITTMGGAVQIQATVVLAVSNLITTLTGSGGAQEAHTRWIDTQPTTAGIQCEGPL